MGRFGSLFKKSEKEKPESNPYAQQPPAGQSSQYDQYAQHNAAQYNSNQSVPQPPLGAPSGLPSGPRPGGLPSRVAPGYGNEQSPPPAYSPGPAHPRGSPYSNTSSPQMGGGFSKEKFGAQDGVGKSRFEPATSSYGSPASTPSQYQGGYGNLDDSDSGNLFANYKPPSQQASGPQDQYGGRPDQDDGSQYMTEEQREEAEVQEIKSRIISEIKATNDSAARSEAKVNEALARALAMTQQTFQQGDMLNNAEKNTVVADAEISKGKVNLSALDHAQKMLDFAGNSKTAIQMREAKKMGYDQQQMTQVEAMERERREAQAGYAQMQAMMENQSQPRPRTLGGGGNKSAFEFEDEEFEDDTGEQRMHNEQIRDRQEAILHGLKQVNGVLKIQGEELNRQVKQIDRMTERTDRNNDGLWKNRVHLESKYLK